MFVCLASLTWPLELRPCSYFVSCGKQFLAEVRLWLDVECPWVEILRTTLHAYMLSLSTLDIAAGTRLDLAVIAMKYWFSVLLKYIILSA